MKVIKIVPKPPVDRLQRIRDSVKKLEKLMKELDEECGQTTD